VRDAVAAGAATTSRSFRAARIFAGANSGAGYGTSAAVAILDEVDIYPGSLPGEGDPVVLAERATKTFPRRKHFYVSTPTIAGRSRIAELYDQSDQSRYFVPCPACGELQLLWFTDPKTGRRGLHWEGELPNLRVWYECEKCSAKIEGARRRGC
jgi:phage terminase large subunit GpA-like protein